MAYLALLENGANRRNRREQVFRGQQDLLANYDEWLIRLPQPVLLHLIAKLGSALERIFNPESCYPSLATSADFHRPCSFVFPPVCDLSVDINIYYGHFAEYL